MQVIKWFQTADWQQTILLDNATYILDAYWNIRSNAWVVSLYTNENVPLFEGKQLNIGVDLLAQVSNVDKPDGFLMVTSIAKEKGVETITRDNMGTDIELIFIGRDEVL